MRDREPVIRTMKASEARQQFSRVLNQVFRRESRVVVEKSGIPVAAIVSAEDLERIKRLDEKRHRDFKVLDEIGAAFEDVPADELEGEVARTIRAGRERLSVERREARKLRRPAATA